MLNRFNKSVCYMIFPFPCTHASCLHLKKNHLLLLGICCKPSCFVFNMPGKKMPNCQKCMCGVSPLRLYCPSSSAHWLPVKECHVNEEEYLRPWWWSQREVDATKNIQTSNKCDDDCAFKNYSCRYNNFYVPYLCSQKWYPLYVCC
jgi:hypothetical protein